MSQKLAQQLWQQSGIQLVTKLKRTIKNRLMSLSDFTEAIRLDPQFAWAY